MQIEIVKAAKTASLQLKINNLLKKGYELRGEVFQGMDKDGTPELCQMMVAPAAK